MTQVSFYVKAGSETGFGHIVRSLALAAELTARGCECAFYSNATGKDRARAGGYDAYALDAAGLDLPDVWVVDLEGGCPPSLATALKEQCDVLVILNGVGYKDGDPGRLVADLVFYQGCTMRPHNLDWTGFAGEWFEGAEWLILRKEFQEERARWKPTFSPPGIVIAGGGSDPKDVTRRMLEILKNSDFYLSAIIGPANERDYSHYGNKAALQFAPDNMARALSGGDIAIVSYGMTAFECLALGIPTIALSISPDHAASAQLVQQRSGRALRNLGTVEQVTGNSVYIAIDEMWRRHNILTDYARVFIDGRGAERVADKIIEKLEEVR